MPSTKAVKCMEQEGTGEEARARTCEDKKGLDNVRINRLLEVRGL